MTGLLDRHRSPAEIMQLYASEDARRDRYGPCTCGSGRKWKFCHGARA
ncbi:MAG TPA: SEC-C metal-binding domain-containing protein [Gaiellales bacterium]|nr:SEC-C metal-binding domain-containing protein [Gaiellales bacterium]